MKRDADVQSDCSWQCVGSRDGGDTSSCAEDAQSDASWNVVVERQLGVFSCRGEDDSMHDGRSDASWDVLERQDSILVREDTIAEPCVSILSRLGNASIDGESTCSDTCACFPHFGKSFMDLVMSAQWNCALSILCTSTEPESLANMRDTCGDSALSWAVYKSKTNRSAACLELVCLLLTLCPSLVKTRSKNGFLPLHDAAWGNAPPAIGTLLCAAFPAAVHEVAQGETPHQVGEYHHKKFSVQAFSRYRVNTQVDFSWSTPENMLYESREMLAEPNWLQSLTQALAQLRRVSLSELASVSALSWHRHFAMPYACARILEGYFKFNLEPARILHTQLPSIPEHKPRRRRKCAMIQRKRASTVVPSKPLELCESYPVDHLREACPKNYRRSAGMNCTRNTRCSFTELMTVADGAGVVYHLKLQTSRTMPRDLQRPAGTTKWPSKIGRQRVRAWERLLKDDDVRQEAYDNLM